MDSAAAKDNATNTVPGTISLKTRIACFKLVSNEATLKPIL